MAKKTKSYLVSMELLYDYNDEDNLQDPAYLSADGVRWEVISWLEELGFDVSIRVVEDREV